MRFVLDLQACQSDSRFRGIGRYSMSIGKALARELIGRGHEVIIGLSNSFPDEIETIKAIFELSVPGVRFFEFSVPASCAASKPENQWRQMSARLLREYALACLEPDIIHVSTLLADGWDDDTIASVDLLGIHIPTVLTHYDLIPLAMSDIYLTNESFRKYYMDKLDNVCRADLLLTISNYTKVEALKYLERTESSVVNMSSAVNDDFWDNLGRINNVDITLEKYGIDTDFLLYAPGGFDPRKNLDRLLEAYALVPLDIRKIYKLVIASKLPVGFRDGLIWKAKELGINESELILTDYVSDTELTNLYRTCRAYIFPSLHEGFGLPVLEAMSCGAVVIASNCTSIPEAHGFYEALFDPKDPLDISKKMLLALADDEFRTNLKNHAIIQTKKFSWTTTAEIAVDAMERLLIDIQKNSVECSYIKKRISCDELLVKVNSLCGDFKPSELDIENFKDCFISNLRAL
ncbi:glycosyltransferase family 4 protein [Dickeya parazeae]|uniref:glycosyltransferase family 4 protein n=1 Tax=Dickeya parazeae TaxID=2893572 RepID=UPI001AECE4A9|nr:glycosyltransferase family 1 protein [Dickeya parazeae]MBP2834511.1 glycosyltransferase family 4 protein [Dickeya parazeae]